VYALGVVDHDGAERGERQLGEDGLEHRLDPFSRCRGDDVEPGVADEHRAGRRGERAEEVRAAIPGPRGRRERAGQCHVEAHPGEVVVPAHVP
jgi:hypothetical protein